MKTVTKEGNILRFTDVESSKEKLRRDDLEFLVRLMEDSSSDEDMKRVARIVHTLLTQSLVQ